MTDYDDLPFSAGDAPGFVVETPRKCYRHQWEWTEWMEADSRVLTMVEWCRRCHAVKDPTVAKRNRNNGKRGRSDELTVA